MEFPLKGWVYGEPVLQADGSTDVPAELLGPFLRLHDFKSVQDIDPPRGQMSRSFPALFKKAELDGQPVFFKGRLIGTDSRYIRTHNLVTEISIKLNRHEVGPQFLGVTVVPRNFYYGHPDWARLVHVWKFIDGQPYNPKFRDGKIVARNQIPPGVRVTQETLNDVRRSFHALNIERIYARDAQFLLTKSGKAYLIDYEEFEYSDSSEARTYNDLIQRKILQGLIRNLEPEAREPRLEICEDEISAFVVLK